MTSMLVAAVAQASYTYSRATVFIFLPLNHERETEILFFKEK